MKKIILSLLTIFSLCVFINAQSTTNESTNAAMPAKVRKPTFRATKDQISAVQRILKVTESGKMTKADKLVLKTYQSENGLKANGSLNRATLEKMGIELTEKQKEIPVMPSSLAKEKKSKTDKTKAGKAVFRASKEQIMQAQKMIKTTETGKLSKEDREGLKAFQTANGIKPTGGLNKVTLEKMGIELTEKQKGM